MRGSAPEITRQDGQLRVEARNAATALAAVTEELGTSARIVAVDKVVRGGIAGFFSRELIQVTADEGVGETDGRPADESGTSDGGQLGAPSAAHVEQTAAVVHAHLAQRRAAAADEVHIDHSAPHRDGPAAEPGIADAPVVDPGPQGPSSFADLLREASLAPPSPADERGRQYVRSEPVEVPQRRSPEMVGSPVAIALDRLLREGDDGDNFGEALRRELQRAGWDPRHGSPATTRIKRVWAGREEASARATRPTTISGEVSTATDEVASAPQIPETVEAEETSEAAPVSQEAVAPALTGDAFRALGLPDEVVEAVDGLPGDARTAWIAAIAGSIAPLCTPLPAGDCAYVGPAAGDLVADSDIPVATMDGPTHVGGDIAVCADDSRAGRGDVEWLRDGRWVHLVVGGGSWRWHVMSEPRAVSWADVTDLPAAIRVAAEHDIALGSPTADPGSRAAADPDTVARALVGLAEHRHGEVADR